MIPLKTYTVKERRPAHDETILLFADGYSFGDPTFDVRFVEIEYTWEELDEEGESTGTSYGYTPGDKPAANVVLVLLGDGEVIAEDAVYTTVEDLEELYANKIKETSPA